MAPKVIHVGRTLITERCYSFCMMLFEVIGWRKTNMIYMVAEFGSKTKYIDDVASFEYKK
jgi:hypothetical protein